MFISPAYAQAAGGAAGGFDPIQIVPFIGIIVVIYFFLMRPQQKRVKEHKEMLSKIRRNDVIVTNGGLIGTVSKVIEDKDELLVEIADGVKIRTVRSMVAEVRAKTEPAAAEPKADKKAASDEKK